MLLTVSTPSTFETPTGRPTPTPSTSGRGTDPVTRLTDAAAESESGHKVAAEQPTHNPEPRKSPCRVACVCVVFLCIITFSTDQRPLTC